jgi:hypothetical protein
MIREHAEPWRVGITERRRGSLVTRSGCGVANRYRVRALRPYFSLDGVDDVACGLLDTI